MKASLNQVVLLLRLVIWQCVGLTVKQAIAKVFELPIQYAA